MLLTFGAGQATAAPAGEAWTASGKVAKLGDPTLDLGSIGYKGVSCDFDSLEITFYRADQIILSVLNRGHNLDDITVQGGSSMETAKFSLKMDQGSLVLQLHQSRGRLQPGTLYKINIPAGTFTDAAGSSTNQPLTINFTTQMQNPLRSDILVSTSPAADAGGVSEKTSAIIFNFMADITLAPDIKSLIAFNNTAVMAGADVDALSNYDIKAVKNQLVLKPKNGAFLKDFVNYRITLAAGAVALQGTSISNSPQELRFTTDRMYASVSPAENQTGVGLEPVIKFAFKRPIEILDRSLISLKADDDPASYPLDPAADITLEANQNLIIDVKDRGTGGLKKNTLYTVTLGRGAVRFLDPQLRNDNLQVSFTTTAEAMQPIVTRYASDAQGTDDICSLTGTRLAPEGDIYIWCDRPLAWDKAFADPLLGAQLFRLPLAAATDYDPQGWSYDKVYTYDQNGAITGEKPVSLKSLTIVEGNKIVVKPSHSFLPLNYYHLKIDRRLVEDVHGCNMEKDIDFYFWTRPAPDQTIPAWEGVAGLAADKVMPGSWQGIKTYTLTGTPLYDVAAPLTMNIDSEVIVKAGDAAALKRIQLTAKGGTNPLDISSYQLEYYFDGVKKTRFSIFPANNELEEDKQYTLSLPGDVFHTRGGVFLPALQVYFIPGGPHLNILALEPASLQAAEVGQGQTSFSIKGSNLDDSIEKVVLTPMAGRCLDLNPLTITKSDLYLMDAGTLKVMLRGEMAAALGREEAAGTYLIAVWHDDGSGLKEAESIGETSLKIVSRGEPEILSYYPAGGSYDEQSLNPRQLNGSTRYFLSVRFKDPDNSLQFNHSGSGLNRLKTCAVYSEGGSQVSMLDTDLIAWIENLDEAERIRTVTQYIFDRQTDTLFIPVRLLRPQTSYTVMLNEDIVKFRGGEGNSIISWSFSTMAVPTVMTIAPGSVAENYASGEYILIEGNFFNSTGVTVKFNDQWAERVEIITREGKPCLKAILPRNSRLQPGLYNVTVINDSNHQQTLYGGLSVIKAATENPPAEGRRTRSEGRLGEVVEKVAASETVLKLNNKYRNSNYVEINLDELMGTKVLARTIEYTGRRGDRIQELYTRSRWADITLYGVTLDSTRNGDQVGIRLGRVEAGRSSLLGTKLRGRQRLSDFIEVSGQNLRIDRVKINLPFQGSEGDKVKVLRYDETWRSWWEVPFTVNRLERTVLINSLSPGIFVVVE